jgi:thiol:disulfide interchange protein DsbC
MTMLSALRPFVVIATTLVCVFPALAQEAAIRKALADRLPTLQKIDEVSRTPIPGLYEVRYNGTELLYSDEKGEFIIDGSMFDTRTQTNLTQIRLDKLTAIDFDSLPLKDAIAIRQGSGARKMAVFVDPNCGYCKRFERELAAIKDVTIYTFLIPILGPDSSVKSRDIWCSKEQARTWRSWMLDGVSPAKSIGGCDPGAVERNVEFSRKHRINGTPAVLFADGTRKPGAMPGDEVERLLTTAARKTQ